MSGGAAVTTRHVRSAHVTTTNNSPTVMSAHVNNQGSNLSQQGTGLRGHTRSGGGAANNAMQSSAGHGGNGGHANTNLHAYQRNFSAPKRFHAGNYNAPRDYSYQRWSFGMRLPSIYFGHNHWISDYNAYDLMDPPDGYVWVRYGPDALLIDEETGEIVQVEYDVFY
jgi:Ni/Co efflux regulator RcnB